MDILALVSISGGFKFILTTLYFTDLCCFIVFSALRAYALSNRRTWLTTIIILLTLPPTALVIVSFSLHKILPFLLVKLLLKKVDVVYQVPQNQPSPFNCGTSSSIAQYETIFLRQVQQLIVFKQANEQIFIQW